MKSALSPLARVSFKALLLFLPVCFLTLFSLESAAVSVRIRSDVSEILAGEVVAIDAKVRGDRKDDCLLLPYVNGKRWGAHKKTDIEGKARFLIPLPREGFYRIEVEVRPPQPEPVTQWIWAPQTESYQRVFFRKSFVLEETPLEASLSVAVDNKCRVILNGQPVSEVEGWNEVRTTKGLARLLKFGRNVLAIQAFNEEGPAALAAKLTVEAQERGEVVFASDESWEVFLSAPPGWPANVVQRGNMARSLGRIDTGPWAGRMRGWPGIYATADLYTGEPMPAEAVASDPLEIEVLPRIIEHETNPRQIVGVEWEPWFTPEAIHWQTAEAVPLMGFYKSYNMDVVRQHCIWMAEVGIDFILVDWTNHLWGKDRWHERDRSVNTIIHATTLTLEALARMREEGIPVPRVVLLPGYDNGPKTTMTAVNEQLDWIYHNYIRNPRFRGLWVMHENKPLIVIFNGGGPAERQGEPPVDDEHFTVRWMSSQMQITHLNQQGYWSWMDGSPRPLPAIVNGKAEALTVTPAYFGSKGWLNEQARGRRGGATYIEQFKAALRHRQKFLLINQWNEFAGQPVGQGYGPDNDLFVDCYNVELSNDIEPVSLDSCGYRDCGGWGFYYLNLTRALLDIYQQRTPDAAVIAIAHPLEGQTVSGEKLYVQWNGIGRPADSFTLYLDNRQVAGNLSSFSHELDLSDVEPGPHTLRLVAEGANSYYRLSREKMDQRLPEPITPEAEVTFELQAE
jgi:hypothetical protein